MTVVYDRNIILVRPLLDAMPRPAADALLSITQAAERAFKPTLRYLHTADAVIGLDVDDRELATLHLAPLEDGILHYSWCKGGTHAEVCAFLMGIVLPLIRHGNRKILADLTGFESNDVISNRAVQTLFIPEAVQAGLQRAALVSPQAVASALSFTKPYLDVPSARLKVRVYSFQDSAMTWLTAAG